MSISEVISKVEASDAGLTTLELPHIKHLNDEQCLQLASALQKNSNIVKVVLDNKGISTVGGKAFAEVIENNTTITYLDLGYNNIHGEGILDLCNGLKKNKTITEMKIHRQDKDYGAKLEPDIVAFWSSNTTLCRLYGTFHDRTCNQVNTRGEVRNKEIAKRVSQNKTWIDLSPFEEDKAKWKAQQEEARRKKAEEEAKANAPITEKVASTGGPYTYKQLTCAVEFRPDDIDSVKKETYLSDEEFQQVLGMDKAAFAGLPKWKMNNKKKEAKLH